ncbi:hypothetical protein K1W54_34340 [Micromonospora sp. CPCC 205371]|nr:hypothetical protein [Micromonospora sp. CPCC 205371]
MDTHPPHRWPAWWLPAALAVLQLAWWPVVPALLGEPARPAGVALALLGSAVTCGALAWRHTAPGPAVAATLAAAVPPGWGGPHPSGSSRRASRSSRSPPRVRLAFPLPAPSPLWPRSPPPPSPATRSGPAGLDLRARCGPHRVATPELMFRSRFTLNQINDTEELLPRIA